MRLNRLGAEIIAVFAVVGLGLIALAVIGAPGAIVFALIGGAYVLGALISVAVAIRARLRARHRRWLAANGLRGRVTIVAASTQMSVNEQPVFDLVVDVEIPGQEPRRVERKLIVGSFAARRMRPGMVLPAYIHPRDPDDLLNRLVTGLPRLTEAGGVDSQGRMRLGSHQHHQERPRGS